MKLAKSRWERVQFWGFYMFIGFFILIYLIRGYNWIWPPLHSYSVIAHGHSPWFLSDEEYGHILSASTCLDEECVIQARVEIACLDVNGADDTFSVSVILPDQYSQWFHDVQHGTAELTLKDTLQEKRLGLINTTVIRNERFTMVDLSAITSSFVVALSAPRDQRDFLKVEGSWPIRFQIPLRGLADGLADLAGVCGKQWKLP